ncbi:hypothetical protein Pmani_030263 [Petrolisthes manimaculis]|uniref:Ig-like domain-containing protein n=1 Tax=Petrolisthes manimaculis TaxID=1843537 RepID=A0AAE1TW34_9EUCA|nr:hypothetical protein Pmani_030263 [Petrolisthes manimaculis]
MYLSTLSHPDSSLPSYSTLLPFSLFLVYPPPPSSSTLQLFRFSSLSPISFDSPPRLSVVWRRFEQCVQRYGDLGTGFFHMRTPQPLVVRENVHHPPETENWDLDITSVTFRDSGVYECQVSTSPKVSLPILLTVLGKQAAVIRGPGEVYVQRGSTISLECEVAAGTEVVGAVSWFRGQHALNYSSPRGGISMEVREEGRLGYISIEVREGGRLGYISIEVREGGRLGYISLEVREGGLRLGYTTAKND